MIGPLYIGGETEKSGEWVSRSMFHVYPESSHADEQNAHKYLTVRNFLADSPLNYTLQHAATRSNRNKHLQVPKLLYFGDAAEVGGTLAGSAEPSRERATAPQQ